MRFRFRMVLLAVVASLLALFLVVNWRVLAAPASFYFVLGSVELPMGAVILGLLALTVLTFAVYVGIWQGTLLKDYRRQSKELQTQRTLADDAEASRFTALSTLLREQMLQQETTLEAQFAQLRDELRDTERSIAATLGEMDDRMARQVNRPGG